MFEFTQNVNSATMLNILVDTLIKSSVVLLLAATIVFFLRKHSAALLHGIWTSAIVLALLAPALSTLPAAGRLPVLGSWIQTSHDATIPASPAGSTQAPSLKTAATVDASSNEEMASSGNPALPSGSVTHNKSDAVNVLAEALKQSGTSWILSIWGLGCAIVALPLLIGTVCVWRLFRRTTRIIDSDTITLKEKLCQELGVSRPVQLLQCHRSMVPVTWGLLYPKIMLPKDAQQWSPKRMRMVLLHELAHVKRKDCFTQMLGQLTRTAIWFNPLVWYAVRKLRTLREQACDDMVLRSGTKPSDYADELLQIVQTLSSAQCSSMAAVAMARKSQFENRLLAILESNRNRRGLTKGLSLITLSLAIVIALPLASVQLQAQAESSAADAQAKKSETSTTANDTTPRTPATQSGLLSYVDNKPTGKRSLGDSGHAVRFSRGDKSNQIVSVSICAARYGTPQPPKNRFAIYILDKDMDLIEHFIFPYSTIKRTKDLKWYTLRIKPTVVPETFYVALVFYPKKTRGIYVGLDETSKGQHSLVGVPLEDLKPWDKGNWMVRVKLKGSAQSPKTSLKQQRRKLLDPRTRWDVSKIDLMFGNYFRKNTRYEFASKAEKEAMVQQWITQADSDNFRKRVNAIAALGNVKAKAGVNTLISVAEEPMRNNRPKWMAVRALAEIGDPRAVPPLIGLVDHGNWNTNVYARAGLAQITGVYFGKDKEKWSRWWDEQKAGQSN